jgi:hypothetical protein
MLLTTKEQVAAAADVASMILSSNVFVAVLRMSNETTLYGGDDADFQEIAKIPIEIDEEPPMELKGKIDAVATALPSADILVEDRLLFLNRAYRVQAIHEEILFGVITHKTLHLVVLHGR